MIEIEIQNHIMLMYDDTEYIEGVEAKLLNSFLSKENAACIGPMTNFAESFQRINRFGGREVLNIIQRNVIVRKFFNPNVLTGKICGSGFFTSKKLFEKYFSTNEKVSLEARVLSFQLEALRDKGMFPYIDVNEYVHQKINPFTDEFWLKERPMVYDMYKKEFLILEYNLYDYLLKNNRRI